MIHPASSATKTASIHGDPVASYQELMHKTFRLAGKTYKVLSTFTKEDYERAGRIALATQGCYLFLTAPLPTTFFFTVGFIGEGMCKGTRLELLALITALWNKTASTKIVFLTFGLATLASYAPSFISAILGGHCVQLLKNDAEPETIVQAPPPPTPQPYLLQSIPTSLYRWWYDLGNMKKSK